LALLICAYVSTKLLEALWKQEGAKSQADQRVSEAAFLITGLDSFIQVKDGNARDAVKALIVANEFLESEVCELMQVVSHAYARGRFKTYTR
jgi:hypothetical protein